jgi:hypothetical protein
MKAEMEAEEGRRGGGAVVGMGEGEEQPCSGAIAIVLSTPPRYGFARVVLVFARRFLDKVALVCLGLIGLYHEAQVKGPIS